MDTSKKAKFVRKMGKKRLKLIKREHFEGGGIAGLIGSAGGLGGSGYDVTSGTTGDQINKAYTQNQAALTDQGALATTLAPQAANAVNAQNVLSGQFADQAQGAGPNVAMNKLNQATGANVANQASLMAGQRGAGANPALIARESAMQGANTQQQSAGQAATLQAEQQIAAEQAQAQLAGNQIAQTQGATTANTQAQQGEQGILQGANTANNNITGGMAAQSQKSNQGLIGGVLNTVGSVFGLSEGGEVHNKKLEFVHKMTKMGLEHHGKPMKYEEGGSVDTTPAQSAQNSMRDAFHFGTPAAAADEPTQEQKNAQIRAQNAKNVGRSDGGVVGYADGGLTVPEVSHYQVPQANFQNQNPTQGGYQDSGSADFMKFGPSGDKSDPTGGAQMMPDMAGGSSDAGGIGSMVSELGPLAMLAYKGGEMHPHFQGPHKSHIANYLLNKGGPVPAMVSAGEAYLTPEQVHSVINEDADPAKIGHIFKGKAKVKGDSKKNDVIPATLEDGGVVVDRDHMGSAEKRKLFVHKAIAKRKAGTR